MKFFVTGGAGFIGSHFCDTALAQEHDVVAFDDLSTGHEEFLEGAFKNSKFKLVRGDIRDLEFLSKAVETAKPDWIIHFAANADVRRGTERPRRDLDYNTIGTWNVLEAARTAGSRKVLFSSTGSVYGEPEVFPTPEKAPFPEQTSFYGASKLAGEALISAYAHGFGFLGVVFRFVSILGPRYSHGHVYDFIKQLQDNPKTLKVLGNGLQTKSYLHIEDLMAGLWTVIKASKPDENGFKVYNIGHDSAIDVKTSISYIVGQLGLEPSLEFSGGTRGWIGDSPRIQLDTTKLKALGWKTQNDLKKSVQDTADYLISNKWLLEEQQQ
ncbi:MAG: NAD-dependent epimerase/dehydratase family protein [Bdellovibrionia bacterium]